MAAIDQTEVRDRLLGSYRLLEELGSGDRRVYKAVHRVLGRTVAVKVIAAELVQQPRLVHWFRRSSSD